MSFNPDRRENGIVAPRKSFTRWFGSAGFITLAVVLLGRLAMEPLRTMPHYDATGMDAFSAGEKFKIAKAGAPPIKIAFFGSSQTLWGVLPEVVEADFGFAKDEVRDCSTAGGTVFEMWAYVKRNPEAFAQLQLAIVEMNPFIMHRGLEDDTRQQLSISQHATFSERLLLRETNARRDQITEWFVPWRSARRTAFSTFLDLVDPEPGNLIYPNPDRRVHPVASDWYPEATHRKQTARQKLLPSDAARRFVGHWKLSLIQDHSMKSLLAWFAERNIPIMLHQLPVAPEVAEIILHDPHLKASYDEFHHYMDQLQPRPVVQSLVLSPTEFGGDTHSMADRTHLNHTGANAYTKHLLSFIRSALSAKPK